MSEEKTLGQRVQAARARLGLSQVAMAERYSIPRRTLQDWELDRRTPPEYVVKLLEVVVEDHGIDPYKDRP